MAATRRDTELRIIWDEGTVELAVVLTGQIELLDPDTGRLFTVPEGSTITFAELPANVQADGVAFVRAIQAIRDATYPLIRP